MMMEIPPAAAEGFSAAADVYERARPGYPEEAIAWLAERLGIGPGRDVLDLAAGTGKLTRQLVPFGARLLCVEPVDEMRSQLAAVVPGIVALAGTAEAIPLPDASVDAITCGQAFHWFRPAEAIHELHRVLRPGGALGLIWNIRDSSDPLEARLDALLQPHRREFPGGEGSWRRELDASHLFGPVEHRTWSHEQVVTGEGFVERVASTSFVAAMPAAERAALLEEVRAAAAELGESITIPYASEVYAADRR